MGNGLQGKLDAACRPACRSIPGRAAG